MSSHVRFQKNFKYSGLIQMQYLKCVCVRLRARVWAWAQWGRKGASSLWGRSMCPASTAVVLGHRCHLLQQPASQHSPPPPSTRPLLVKQRYTGGEHKSPTVFVLIRTPASFPQLNTNCDSHEASRAGLQVSAMLFSCHMVKIFIISLLFKFFWVTVGRFIDYAFQ